MCISILKSWKRTSCVTSRQVSTAPEFALKTKRGLIWWYNSTYSSTEYPHLQGISSTTCRRLWRIEKGFDETNNWAKRRTTTTSLHIKWTAQGNTGATKTNCIHIKYQCKIIPTRLNNDTNFPIGISYLSMVWMKLFVFTLIVLSLKTCSAVLDHWMKELLTY